MLLGYKCIDNVLIEFSLPQWKEIIILGIYNLLDSFFLKKSLIYKLLVNYY